MDTPAPTTTPDSLLSRYGRALLSYEGNPVGAAQVLFALVKGLGVTALSGIKGLSTLPQGMDAAAQAVADYQQRYGQPSLGAAGIQSIRDIAPVFQGAAQSPLGSAAHRLSAAYDEGSQHLSDLAGRYLGPTAAGVMGAIGEAAPAAITPEGAIGKAALEGLSGDALGALVKQYAPEAEHLASQVADTGGVTYHPGTGDIHGSGYVVPTQAARSQALDTLPSADDIHSYMMDNQDAFDEDPNAVLHIHSNPGGSFLHVAHHTPDFGDASDKAGAAGLPGFSDVATGEVHPASPSAAARLLYV